MLRQTVPRISETRTNLDENLSFYILIKIPKNVLKPYGERNNKWPFRREIKEIVVENERIETLDKNEVHSSNLTQIDSCPYEEKRGELGGKTLP